MRPDRGENRALIMGVWVLSLAALVLLIVAYAIIPG
jgi:hypothetical protein